MKPHDPDDFLPTRSSLLSRLRDSSDAESWRHFLDHYGRLIFQVCLRSGLTRQESEEVVQETVTSVSRTLPKFQYDRSKGSFKGWLARVTRNHIADFLTRKTRDAARRVELPAEQAQSLAADPDVRNGGRPDLDAVWESEWRGHLLARALARVEETVSTKSIQIFQLSAVQGWSIEEIAASLRVPRARIYLARHRVGRLVKREIERLRKELE
ncbi:MAG: sigma-70 family RNA polymerase sigma factor [Verrucomicrobiota bacterium]